METSPTAQTIGCQKNIKWIKGTNKILYKIKNKTILIGPKRIINEK